MKTLVALIILSTLALPAVAQQGDCTALTHQALELSGLNQSILDMTQMLNSEQFMQQVSRGRSGASDFSTKFKPIMLRTLMDPSCAASWKPGSSRSVIRQSWRRPLQ